MELKLLCEKYFPNPEKSYSEGLTNVGLPLNMEVVICAYFTGVFPWYNAGQPTLWWCPDPRFVLFTSEYFPSSRINKIKSRHNYNITVNQCFEQVIRKCGAIKRKGQSGTWITKEMIGCYLELHKNHLAHSIEVWKGEKLVGGLYGVLVGSVFCGESMFSEQNDASKIAFHHLLGWCERAKIPLIDCQVYSEHLSRFGAREIPRKMFLDSLKELRERKPLITFDE